DKDFSTLPLDYNVDGAFRKEHLSKLTLSYVMKRLDGEKLVMDCCLLPRPLGVASAEEVLEYTSEILSHLTQINGDIPPYGTSADAATCNGLVLRAWMGLLPDTVTEKLPFFRECTRFTPRYPYWPFSRLVFRTEHVMCGGVGAYHTQKRLSLQVASGCKFLVVGDLWVDQTAMLGQGLSEAAYSIKDFQSDSQAVARMSPCWIRRGWCDLGNHVFCFYVKNKDDLAETRTCMDRTPMDEDSLCKVARQACASAVQFFSCITSLSADEVVYDLRKWWDTEGPRYFQACGRQSAASEEDDEDLTPDCQEVTDLQPSAEPSSMVKLVAVQDRALATEELKIAMQELQTEADGACTVPAEDMRDVVDVATTWAPDADEPGTAPKTLLEVLKRAIRKGGAHFNMGEAPSVGTRSMFLRLHDLVGPMRAFTRQARCEEGIITPAQLERGQVELNDFNYREHLLAVARRSSNISHHRLARSTAWAEAQTHMIAELRAKITPAKGHGVMQPESYRPNKDGKNLQVLVCKLDGAVQAVAVLTVFRGSVVRKPESRHSGTVRVGKPMPCEVPAASAKVLRGTLLQQEGQDQHHWVTSCTATPLLFDPSGCVIGELETAEMRESATRLHVQLSHSAVQAVRLLMAGKIAVPELPPGNPEQDEGAPAETSDAAAQPAAQDQTFTDRSFVRKSLDKTVDLFIRGLIQEYRKSRVQIVSDDGKIKTKTSQLSYDEVCKMIPGFFLSSGSSLQGHRFSQYVHRELTGLLPKAGNLSNGVKEVHRFFSQVAKYTPGQVKLTVG
ncbi:unnamed protein product, partial [Symbiodinium sp. CCMP2456]